MKPGLHSKKALLPNHLPIPCKFARNLEYSRNSICLLSPQSSVAALFTFQTPPISQPLRTDEFETYLLNGLYEDYDSLVEAVLSCDSPMPIRDLYARLSSTEQQIESRRSAELINLTHSANAVRAHCHSTTPLSAHNSSQRRPRSGRDRAQPRRLPQNPSSLAQMIDTRVLQDAALDNAQYVNYEAS